MYSDPVTLSDQFVRLEPLALTHAQDLAVAGKESKTWDYMPMEAPRSVAEMESAIQTALNAQESGARLPFAIIDLRNGQPV